MRNAILALCFAAYFIIAPIIILYTAGYRYDWKNGLLRETGSISIDIMPKDATVYLNDVELGEKMPIELNNITPKKYHIKITAPGYFDWQKEVEVKNIQTVYIKEIMMIQKHDPQIMTDKSPDYVSLSPDGRYLIYFVRNVDKGEIWLHDGRKQNDELVASWPNIEMIRAEWAENNSYAAISNDGSPFTKLLIFDALNPKKQLDLVKKAGAQIDKFQWKETTEPELYFGTRQKIMSIRPKTEEIFTLSSNKFVDWFMEAGEMWTLRSSASTSKLTLWKNTLGFQSDFATISKPVQTSGERLPDHLQIVAAKNDHVLLKQTDRPEMILATAQKNYDIAGDKFLISKYNDWWLIWTQWELWTYSNGEEPHLLNRSGEKLQQVIPLDQYNTLALVWADKTTALFPYYLVSHNLLDTKVKSAAADSTNRIFYFSGEVNGKAGLWQLMY